MALKIQNI